MLCREEFEGRLRELGVRLGMIFRVVGRVKDKIGG